MGAATSGNARLGHLPFQCLHISCAGVAASPVARCTAVRPATIRSSAIVDVLRRTLHDDETHTTVTVTNRNCVTNTKSRRGRQPAATSQQFAHWHAGVGAVAFVSPVRCAAACGSGLGGGGVWRFARPGRSANRPSNVAPRRFLLRRRRLASEWTPSALCCRVGHLSKKLPCGVNGDGLYLAAVASPGICSTVLSRQVTNQSYCCPPPIPTGNDSPWHWGRRTEMGNGTRRTGPDCAGPNK